MLTCINAWGRLEGGGYFDTPRLDQVRFEQPRYDTPRLDQVRFEQPRYEKMNAPRFDGSNAVNLRAIRVLVDENQKIGAVGIEDFRLPIGHRVTENVDLDNVEQASLDIQLPSSNVGFRLLQKMEWKGKELGKDE